MSKQRGFTLIELIIVIIILSILAVIALPRFLNAADEAKVSKMKAVAGSFDQGVKHARYLWEVAGRPGALGSNEQPEVDYDGRLVRVDANTGWPTGSSSSVINCLNVFSDIMTTTMKVANRTSPTEPSPTARAKLDIIVTKTSDSANGDSCNYYLSESITGQGNNPAEGVPTAYMGFSYQTRTGEIETFDFIN